MTELERFGIAPTRQHLTPHRPRASVLNIIVPQTRKLLRCLLSICSSCPKRSGKGIQAQTRELGVIFPGLVLPSVKPLKLRDRRVGGGSGILNFARVLDVIVTVAR